MSRRAEIKELALAASDALTIYIFIHNAIFREAATFKSLLKNLVGRGVPMSKLLEDAERLPQLWDVIHERILDFRRSLDSSLPEEERRYVESFHDT